MPDRIYRPKPEPGPLARAIRDRPPQEQALLKTQALAQANRELRSFTYHGLEVRLASAPVARPGGILEVSVLEVLDPSLSPVPLFWPKTGERLNPVGVGNPFTTVPDGTWRKEVGPNREVDVENTREDLGAAYIEALGRTLELLAQQWGRL